MDQLETLDGPDHVAHEYQDRYMSIRLAHDSISRPNQTLSIAKQAERKWCPEACLTTETSRKSVGVLRDVWGLTSCPLRL